MYLIKKLLLKIINLSPIFSVSSDELFGDIDVNVTKRYSLVRFSLGFTKIYFMSIADGKFDLVKVVNLNKLRPWPSIEVTQDKLKSYEDLIAGCNDDELLIQARFLDKRIDVENNVKSLFQNKVSSYNAILLLVAGYIIYIAKELLENREGYLQNYALLFVYVIVVVYFINSIVFLYHYLKNKTASSSKFSDIKSDSTLAKLSSSYYFDWFNVKEERDVLSNYVKNLEKYLARTVITLIVLSLLMIALDINKNNNGIIVQEENELASISLLNENGEFSTTKSEEIPIIIYNNQEILIIEPEE